MAYMVKACLICWRYCDMMWWVCVFIRRCVFGAENHKLFPIYIKLQTKSRHIHNFDRKGSRAMKNFKHDIGLRLVKLLNVLLVAAPFAFCWYAYYGQRLYIGDFYRNGNFAVIGLFVLVYVIFARVYDAFVVSVNRFGEIPKRFCSYKRMRRIPCQKVRMVITSASSFLIFHFNRYKIRRQEKRLRRKTKQQTTPCLS